MRYASVCDGIGAVHVAWQPLGWECVWTSEVEPFPAAVVDHHWKLKNLGDMTAITEEMLRNEGPISLLVGGTPCQSFSVAGLRRGLDDPRGNLALRFTQLVGVLRPTWVVWENVPGVLSSAGGRDFGTFLGALAELGYGFAYRILDAQWFGVAQRRRRVFVVAHARDWRRAAAVLFEPESLFGNPPTRGAKGQGTAARTQGGTDTCGTLCADNHPGGYSGQDAYTGRLVSQPYFIDRASFNQCQNAQYEAQIKDDGLALSLVARGPGAVAFSEEPQAIYSNESRCDNIPPAGLSPPLKIGSDGGGVPPAIAFKPSHYTRGKDGAPSEVAAPLSADADKGDQDTVVATVNTNQNASGRNTPMVAYCCDETAGTIRSNTRNNSDPATEASMHVMHGMAVRRLTPRECERLQGFPDDYTLVTYRGKPSADGPRYRALGNSMAVPVMRWIGERIAAVDVTCPEEVAHGTHP